jgi:Lhr-like helicase
MAERDQLLSSLVKEVLGPRNGPHEVLRADEDPLEEYLCGVLAPYQSASVAEDAEVDLVGEPGEGSDDQADAGEEVSPVGFDPGLLPRPSLDPRARPASLGISFLMDGPVPSIDICCTWGRYVATAGGSWKRVAHGESWSRVDCRPQPVFTLKADSGAQLVVKCRSEGPRWRVTLFFVNRTVAKEERATTDEHIFQPQLRVCASEGAKLLPIEDALSGDEQELLFALQYRDRLPMARGHLCGAVWKAVDPQRPHGTLALPRELPFLWADGEATLPAAVYQWFSWPDVRTEYVPIVPVNAPRMEWPGTASIPLLDPEQLSELWDAASLQAALQPIADGYQAWIGAQHQQLPGLPTQFQAVARTQLARCQSACDRIRAGIVLLAMNADARLSFCFANKAMAMQASWRGKRVQWRPFQLAFQLLNLPALTDESHPEREVCDLLWFPTGGGKTEAYLGLAAFALGFRRLRALRSGQPQVGAGTAVLSRYTLRLLTVQQFRRALALITACELLRVTRSPGAVGWRPKACSDLTPNLWGTTRFSVGLWVGGSVTPNNLQNIEFKNRTGQFETINGAISILEGAVGEGEPAQVLNCPRCEAILAIPTEGFQRGGRQTLHFVMCDVSKKSLAPTVLSSSNFQVGAVRITPHPDPAYVTVSIDFTVLENTKPEVVESWFKNDIRPALGGYSTLLSARASRPGYFIRTTSWGVKKKSEKPFDFEIVCPNPVCELNTGVDWSEETPGGHWPVHEAFASAPGRSSRCPIPAWTVDEQVYGRCPSMVIATVDKFARLAFKPEASSLFGNVDRYNLALGYYRTWCPPRGPSSGLLTAAQRECQPGRDIVVSALAPPELILQDELHLIEGPLGSMVGLYETAVDLLAGGTGSHRRKVKYVASTATVRHADEQVGSLFQRKLEVFPPAGLTASDSFFSRTPESHPVESSGPGRLYVGICAPGRGAQTPTVRLWARLLQHSEDRRTAGANNATLDPFWTLVGYFNAIRELAAAVALARQDILQRLGSISGTPRSLDATEPIELSSRTNSIELPGLLDHLGSRLGSAQTPVNAVVATSMFGTGVDVDRLGLMVVHGQPKTTSSYIQATGRVGRSSGGLVVTFLRAARPRDLNHYEFFVGYHLALHRHVEPVTVNPFSPRARDRGLGAVSVAVLRQISELFSGGRAIPVQERWRAQQRLKGGWYCLAADMARGRTDADVQTLPELMEARAMAQPSGRAPVTGATRSHAIAELDRWQQIAAGAAGQVLYNEPTMVNPASNPVVLGDLAHLVAGLPVAFENAPNSLREVEATTTIQGWRKS